MGVFCSAQCSCPHKMGALMSIIQGDPGAADFIFVDFENAQPSSDEERAVYDSVAAVLDESGAVLDKLRNYDGCEELIKKAIQEPSPETMDEAWEALLPNIDMLKEHYDYSLKSRKSSPICFLLSARTTRTKPLGNYKRLPSNWRKPSTLFSSLTTRRWSTLASKTTFLSTAEAEINARSI